MAGAVLSSSLIVRLVDQVSAPARSIGKALLGIQNVANGRGGFGAALSTAIERNNQALTAARGKLFDAAAGFYALRSAIGSPIQKAMDFQTALEDIGQKADIPAEKLPALGKQLKQVARDANQSTMEMAKAVDFLIGMGAKSETALTVALPIGKAATAYRAASEDLAKATFAVVDNLKTPADQAQLALDAMAKAGKEGGFELKDMAKEFPALTAGAQFLGMKGVPAVADLAAALEVARKGAADGSQAANNMANFLQKISSKETIKNFEGFGVNVSKELDYAAKHGISPVEHMLNVLNKVTKGGDPELISKIFGDKQVLEFVKPMLANMDEYRRIRDAALNASGTVEADFARRLETSQAKIDRFKNSFDNLQTSLGTALLPLLTQIVEKLVPIVDKIGEWVDKNPELASTITAVVAGLIAFKVAAAGLNFVGLLGQSGALQLLSLGFNTIGKSAIAAKEAIALQTALAAGAQYGAFAKFVDGIKGMALAVPGISALSGAVTALVGAISGPVILVIGALAAAGFVIWKYWDRLSSIFTGVGQAILDAASGIPGVQPLFDWLGGVGKLIGDGFKGAWDAISGFLSSLFSQEKLSDGQKEEMRQAGYKAMMAMLDGMKEFFGSILAWFASWPQQILDAIGKIDIGSLFQWPEWLGGAPGTGGAPAIGSRARPSTGYDTSNMANSGISGQRAGGGPVWAGSTYRINERGQEFFTPGRSGTIHPAGSIGGSSITIGDIYVQGASDPAETARRVRDELRSLIRGAHADMEVR